jgi:hypothetical protein
MVPGETGCGKVLDPDARMEEFGLMSSHDKGCVGSPAIFPDDLGCCEALSGHEID